MHRRAARPPAAYHRPMPTTDPDALRAALRGVRALVLDADGVLVLRNRPIPGATEALVHLEATRTPYRIVTNYSSAHRSTLAARFSAGGAALDPARLITAASATAAHTAARFAGRPIYVIAAGDAMREFDGQVLLDAEAAAAATPGEVAAIVIGDGGDELSYRNLDIAFGHIRAGAAFLAMHRNPWWLTAKGPTLDSGAMVAGLEYATGVRVTVLGKPSPEVFRQALAAIRGELGERVAAASVAMVGDDPDADVRAAQRVGLRGVLVLSGKTRPEDLDGARLGTGRRAPDAIAPSLTEVVAALD
jgi:HAD superfamily hydrolase (TIGR01450 family)